MQRELGRHQIGVDLRAAVCERHDRGGGFVAARLDAENDHRRFRVIDAWTCPEKFAVRTDKLSEQRRKLPPSWPDLFRPSTPM
jgi:hypothetical protein